MKAERIEAYVDKKRGIPIKGMPNYWGRLRKRTTDCTMTVLLSPKTVNQPNAISVGILRWKNRSNHAYVKKPFMKNIILFLNALKKCLQLQNNK